MSDNERLKVDDLRWARIFTPVHVPKYLIEQIPDKDFTVEDFFKYQEINCLIDTEEGQTLNPLSHLYVLVNKDNITKGILWFTVDALSKDLVIQTYSIDKEYWGNGGAVKKLAEHVKEIRRKANLKKIYWITRSAKHSQKHGFRESKNVLMEYSEQDEKESDIREENRS